MSLVTGGLDFQLKYQKVCGNTVADVLSQVRTHLDPDMVRPILNGVILGAVHQGKVHDPAIVRGDHSFEQEVHVAADSALAQMHITDLTEAQKEDPVLSAV